MQTVWWQLPVHHPLCLCLCLSHVCHLPLGSHVRMTCARRCTHTVVVCCCRDLCWQQARGGTLHAHHTEKALSKNTRPTPVCCYCAGATRCCLCLCSLKDGSVTEVKTASDLMLFCYMILCVSSQPARSRSLAPERPPIPGPQPQHSSMFVTSWRRDFDIWTSWCQTLLT